MPKPWKEVITSQQYQQLNPQQKAAAQEQYFNDVVAPKAGAQVAIAKQHFYSAYPIDGIKNLSTENTDQPRSKGFLSNVVDGLKETGRAAAQGAVNVANIIPQVGDAVVSAGAWAGQKIGLGDGTYTPAARFELPESMKPETQEGEIASEILPYLVPATSAARAAKAVESVANAPRIEKTATKAAELLSENAIGVLAGSKHNANLGEDMATATTLGAVTKGAFNLVGAGYRAAKGSLSKEAQEAIHFAEKNNVPLVTSDLLPPETFAGRSAQALGEKVPVTGTGGIRKTQQDARSQLVQKYTESFGVSSPDEIVKSLKLQNSKIKQVAGDRLSHVNEQMMSAGDILPQKVLDSLDMEIQRLSRLGGVSDTQTLTKLQAYRDELSNGADFALLRDIRTQFRQDVKGERVAWATQSDAAVNRVYSSLTDDINHAVESNMGQEAARKYKQANAVYANEANLIKNTRLKNVLQKGELTPEVVNSLLFSHKQSEVQQLYRSLNSTGRNAARAAVIGKAYEKSKGSPDLFLNEIKRMSSQTGILFKGHDRQSLKGLVSYLESTRRAAKSGAVTPTGQEMMQVGAPILAFSDVAGTGGVGTAAFASYGMLARVYESNQVRNAMLRLANTPKGSSAFEKNLQLVNNAVNAVAQGVKNKE